MSVNLRFLHRDTRSGTRNENLKLLQQREIIFQTEPGKPLPFGAWPRLHGVDLIAMLFMGAVSLGIYEARTFGL